MNTPRLTMPTRGLDSKAFRYRSSVDTDIRKTFARVKRELADGRRDFDSGQALLEFGTVLRLDAEGVK